MPTAAELYALQEIDLALDRDLGRLAEIEGELGETEELVQARLLKEEKGRALAELRSHQSELEWGVDEVRAKASNVEAKLYGGAVRNPKELEDLQADVKALQSQTRRREDALLALLVEIDDAEAEFKSAETAYSQLEGDWQVTQTQLEAEKSRLQPEVERLQAKRSAEASAIDRSSLSLYQLLCERRGGRAVAKVERGMCQGCRITLPMSILQKARTGLGLVQCVSCERILLVN